MAELVKRDIKQFMSMYPEFTGGWKYTLEAHFTTVLSWLNWDVFRILLHGVRAHGYSRITFCA